MVLGFIQPLIETSIRKSFGGGGGDKLLPAHEAENQTANAEPIL
jgi:hypothetical protein